jgi:hypothetical protein
MVAGSLGAVLALAAGCARHENVPPSPPSEEAVTPQEESPKPPSDEGNKSLPEPERDELVLLA